MDKKPGGGGLAIHVQRLARHLSDAGHDSAFLHLVDRASRSGQAPAWPHEYRLWRSYGWVRGYALRSALQRILNEVTPDIVHIHGCFTSISPVLLSVMKKNAATVGTLHDIRPFCYLMTRRFAPLNRICKRTCGAGCFTSGCIRPRDPVDVLRLCRRWAVDAAALHQWRRFDRVIAPSTYLCELAMQHGIAQQQLRRIPHGVELPAQQALPEDTLTQPVILFVGSLVEYKGVLQLVRALSLLQQSEWRAVIVGSGPLRDEVARQLAHAGLTQRVQLIDHVTDRKELDAMLAGARMLVLPSTIPESFSLAGVEALAAGTPVVTFGLGGVNEWFRDGENGLAAQDLDCSDLAKCMDRLVASHALAAELGASGRQRVMRHFAQDDAFNNTISVYRELVAGQP